MLVRASEQPVYPGKNRPKKNAQHLSLGRDTQFGIAGGGEGCRSRFRWDCQCSFAASRPAGVRLESTSADTGIGALKPTPEGAPCVGPAGPFFELSVVSCQWSVIGGQEVSGQTILMMMKGGYV